MDSSTTYDFITFMIAHNALQFGNFTLKSGRKSPYFFNLGVFNTGEALTKLAWFYAKKLEDSQLSYDMLFGPAYKGIPLATATSMSLYEHFNKSVPYCFNRKEQKTHGDKGTFVGATLSGNVIMLDDVITAGTTVRETIALIKNTSATLNGILIAFDRQEAGESPISAVQETINNHHIPVQSIVTLTDVISYLAEQPHLQREFDAVQTYQLKYGAK